MLQIKNLLYYITSSLRLVLVLYSESRICEYLARVFYNVVFSTYLRSNAAEKRV